MAMKVQGGRMVPAGNSREASMVSNKMDSALDQLEAIQQQVGRIPGMDRAKANRLSGILQNAITRVVEAQMLIKE